MTASILSLEFTRPWLLLLLIPALLMVYWFFRVSLTDFSKSQRWISLIARSIMLASVVLAVAGLHWLRTTKEPFFVVLSDESQSISDEGSAAAKSFVEALRNQPGTHRIAVLPFAATPGSIMDAQTWLDPKPKNTQGPNADSNSLQSDPTKSSYRRDTDIAAALQSASGYMPPGYVPHIVMLTDGNETVGDALSVAGQSRIPISTVPVPAPTAPEVQVAEVNVPAEVREGEPFMVDTQQVQDGCLQVMNVHGLLGDVHSEFIGRSVLDSGLDASASHPDRIGVGMMISSPSFSVVDIVLDERCAAKFAAPDHKGVV